MKRLTWLTSIVVISILSFLIVQVHASSLLGNITGSYSSTSSYVFNGQLKAVSFTVVGGDRTIVSIDMVLSTYDAISDNLILTLNEYQGGFVPGPVIANLATYRVPALPVRSPVLRNVPIVPTKLEDGKSYWLVATAPGDGFVSGLVWHSTNPAVLPTGLFTPISYAFKGAFAPDWASSGLYNAFSLNEASNGASNDGIRTFFQDGRLNRYDSAAPFVVYPTYYDGDTQPGMHIYSNEGSLLLIVLPSMIAAVPEKPEVNTLIAEGGGVQVWRLSSGEFQAMGTMYNGKTYILIFESINAWDEYRSFEVE